VVAVVSPSLLGVLTSWFAGEARMAPARPHVKLASSLALLVLCYTNAAVSLPEAVAGPDWDFLAVLLAASVGLCVLTLAGGLGPGPAAQPGRRPADRPDVRTGDEQQRHGPGAGGDGPGRAPPRPAAHHRVQPRAAPGGRRRRRGPGRDDGPGAAGRGFRAP